MRIDRLRASSAPMLRRPWTLFIMVYGLLRVRFPPTTCSGFQGFHRGSRRRSLLLRHASLSVLAATDGVNVNPTKDWKGSSASSSEYVTHVLVDSNMINRNSNNGRAVSLTVLDAVQSILDQQQQQLSNADQPRRNISSISSSGSTLIHTPHHALTARDLIELGSVWFLPHSAPRDPAQGVKPIRLTSPHNETRILEVGDYLRVHHTPRRFLQVHEYDWSKNRIGDGSSGGKPGVIVAEDAEKGWLVIDKPHGVPVHMTVDNCLENVQSCLYRARTTNGTTSSDSDSDVIYVSTPQRLDQNTSGLLVVATSKMFAAYFAQLLRYKTELQLKEDQDHGRSNNNTTPTGKGIVGSVHKVYRCLVCINQPSPPTNNDNDHDDDASTTTSPWSVNAAVNELKSYVTNDKVMRHFLEPSIRAPKKFVAQPPASDDDDENGDSNTWPECLLKIRSVGQVCALVGNRVGQDLGRKLWSEEEIAEDKKESRDGEDTSSSSVPFRIPANCKAVVELEVELLTGRTHQIRGQLAASGFPLVGDTQYGGAIPIDATALSSMHLKPERLALQCCELEFVDPDIVKKENDGTLQMKRSQRWNKFRLPTAWWTPLIEEYDEEMNQLSASEATTSMFDTPVASTPPVLQEEDEYNHDNKPAKTHLLPERIQLSPGKNKYVLIRATHPKDDKVQWFVKSAAPEECGGPYHGNVAQDLREWIEAAGYSPHVTGGGRIDYDPSAKRCIVYGFSYGFGKGDHEFAANLIRQISGIPATHDDRDGLY